MKRLSVVALASILTWTLAQAAETTSPARLPLRKLMDTPLRDTSICRGGPGDAWYLTGTVEPFWAYNEGIRVWKSTNLVNWEPLGMVWKYGASPWHEKYLKAKKPLWAPEIHHLKGTFWLTYSIPGWDGTGKTSGCGLLRSTSGKAEGPYVDVQPGERMGDEIDASLFEDEDGAVYFLWHSGKIARMKADMSGLAEPYRWLRTAATDPKPNHHSGLCAGIFGKDSFDHVGYEGMFLFKESGRYYLSCAENFDGRYSCAMATSTNINGPYSERYEAIPHGGHNTFFKDRQGQWWSTYFGSDPKAPWQERPGILPVAFDADGRVRPKQTPPEAAPATLSPRGASKRAPRVQSPPTMEAIREVGGYIGQRVQANREGYLKPFDIDRYTRMVEEKKQRDWWWIGEQPGKWLESAVLTSRQAGDAPLEEKARKILARLEKAQETTGYLGITDPAVRTEKRPVRGMDPYELYFMLHGLLTAAQELGDPGALEAARRLGGYFVDHIGPAKAEFWPSPYRPPENLRKIICPQFTWVPPGTAKTPNQHDHSEIAGHTAHYGWEGTLLIDPILRLYQATGDPRFLEWGRWITANLDRWSGWDAFSNLDKVAEGSMGVHQLQPYVHAHTFQMNFLGFLRLYEITGDATLLRKVRGAWADVAARQLYITGGVSVGEHYEPGYLRPITGPVVETCASMSWMELTQMLLELTGDTQYADAIERLMLNHVFASQTVDGDCYRYHTPPNGFKPDDYFHGPDCCTGSGHRLVAMLPRFIYGEGRGGLYVNQYVSSSVTFALGTELKVTLRQETRYPEEDTTVVRVTPTQPAKFALNLRVPGWCKQPAIEVNGKPLDSVQPGRYVSLDRTWAAGDTVRVVLPMKPQWVEHDHFSEGPAPWALIRGPVVYALDTVWWDESQAPRPFEIGREAGIDRDADLRETPPGARAMGPFLEGDVMLLSGRKTRARFVPFTNIGRWYRDNAARPDRHGRTYSYAVWLQDHASPGFARMVEEQKRVEELARASLDYVTIGNLKSETEHRLAGLGTTGPFRNRMFRHAGSGQWFSWELKVSTEEPCDLIITYWGGETDKRVFDVLVDGQKVATQTLLMNKPGEFFEARHAIPFETIKDKTNALGQKKDRVEVRFQAHSGMTAGGVFGLRVAPASK